MNIGGKYMSVYRIIFITALCCFAISSVKAQDDMYFTPKKNEIKEKKQEKITYYRGSTRNVDEYNRRGKFASAYFNLDSDTLYNDVIDFHADSAFVDNSDSINGNVDFDYSYTPEDDYVYTRRMCRYDDFYWYDPWWYGWYGYGPYWYGSPYWYAGWWYDPWYSPWYYGWYRPWGWYYPRYWYGSYHVHYGGVTGTMNHGCLYGHGGGGYNNNFKGYRGTVNSRNNNDGFGKNRYNNRYNNLNNNNRFKGNRQNNNDWINRQNRPSNNNSFGGSRSGGSFRGGGSFGGSRSGGGGGGFRGRR